MRVIDGGAQAVLGMGLVDYIWTDPEGELRCKKKPVVLMSERGGEGIVPLLSDPWVATTPTGRVILAPCRYQPNPLRGEHNYVLLCETRLEDNSAPHPSNTRALLRNHLTAHGDPLGTWWGFRQGFRFRPKFYQPPPDQYLAAERLVACCLDAGIMLHSAQVDDPSGKWWVKIGPRYFPDELDQDPPSAPLIADQLVLVRYFLEKIAQVNKFTVEYTNCSVYLSVDDGRQIIRDVDAPTFEDVKRAIFENLTFPKGCRNTHRWEPRIRRVLALGDQREARYFLEDRGLHPKADPHITATRILEALLSQKES